MSKQAQEFTDPSRSRSTHEDAGEERRCPVCSVKLTSYNPGPNCYRHTIGHPWRGPTAKPKF